MKQVENRWLRRSSRYQDIKYKARIFCLPYAGGGATVFAGWQKFFPDIEVCPIQLPGRENRINEPLVDNAQELADMVFEGIKDELELPYVLFGHSMGGVLAYEAALKIGKSEYRDPLMIFMSATAVELKPRKELVYLLDDDSFARHLAGNGGTYRELVNNEVFRDSYFPIIRNDYKLSENYINNGEKVNCKIHAFASTEDNEVSCLKTLKLSNYTDDFEISYFTGDHFFIRNHTEEICQKISYCISRELTDMQMTGGDYNQY